MSESVTPESEAARLYRHCKRAIGSDDPASYDCPHPDVDDVEAALAAAEERGAEKWRGYFNELCDVLFPDSVGKNRMIGWKDVIAQAKAAEERGRRSGVEERDELREAFKSAVVALNVAEGWLTGLGRHREAEQMRGWHQKALDALAPRASALNVKACRSEDGLPVVSFDRDALHGQDR